MHLKTERMLSQVKFIVFLFLTLQICEGYAQSADCDEIKRKWNEQVTKNDLPNYYKSILKVDKHSEKYFENLMIRCQLGKMYADDSTLLGFYRELMDTMDVTYAFGFFKAFSLEMFPVHLVDKMNKKHWRIFEMTNDDELLLRQLILGSRIYSTFTTLDESITLHDYPYIRKYVPDTSSLWLNFAGPCVSALKNNERKSEVEPLLKQLYKANENPELLIHLFSFYESEGKLKKIKKYKSATTGLEFLEIYFGVYYAQAEKFDKARLYFDPILSKLEISDTEGWKSVGYVTSDGRSTRTVSDKHLLLIADSYVETKSDVSKNYYQLLADKLELMPKSLAEIPYYQRFGYDCGSDELRDKLEQQFNEKYIADREIYQTAKQKLEEQN